MTAPAETETATHVLTDEGFPIGWSVIADHPELAYLADPEASRPATPAEMEALEAAAHAEYEAFLAIPPPSRVPHGPWPHTKAAPEAGPAAVTVVDQPAAEPAEDPAPVLNPIAELALSRFEAAFAEDPAGEGDRAQPDATAVMPVADQHTEAIPAATEGEPA